MTTSTLIISISIVLILGVIGSIIQTKIEQAAALRRQKAANLRYSAEEAQTLYHDLQNAGLEKMAYLFLLERVIFNLKEAYSIDPTASGANLRLSRAIESLESFDITNCPLYVPSSMFEFNSVIAKLNKFINYVHLLFQNRVIKEQQYQNLVTSLQQSILRFEVEGYLIVGHQANADGLDGTAKENYLHAQDKLLSVTIDDNYVQAQLEKIDSLLQMLDRDLNPIEDSPNEQENQQDTQHSEDNILPENKAEITKSKSEISAEQAVEEAVATQKELNKRNPSAGGFMPKKKW